MRRLPTAIGLLLIFTLPGCGSSKADVEELQERWSAVLDAEMPPGTNAAVLRQWFQDQGMQVRTSPYDPPDFQVWLGSIKAEEWFCRKWDVELTVKVSPRGNVAAYEFGSIGTCL